MEQDLKRDGKLVEITGQVQKLLEDSFENVEFRLRNGKDDSTYRELIQADWRDTLTQIRGKIIETEVVVKDAGLKGSDSWNYRSNDVIALVNPEWDWLNSNHFQPVLQTQMISLLEYHHKSILRSFSLSEQAVEGVAQAGGYNIGMIRDTQVVLESNLTGSHQIKATTVGGKLLRIVKTELPIPYAGGIATRTYDLNLQLLY